MKLSQPVLFDDFPVFCNILEKAMLKKSTGRVVVVIKIKFIYGIKQGKISKQRNRERFH